MKAISMIALSVDTKRRHELRSQYLRFQWVTYNFGLCSMLREGNVDNINVVTQNVCIKTYILNKFLT